MARYRVVWTEVALRDLESILDYIIDNDGLLNAEKVHAKLDTAIDNLASVPRGGRVVPELRAEGLDQYRELLVAKVWRVIFRVRGPHVVILAVLDGRRDLRELLFERTMRDPTRRP